MDLMNERNSIIMMIIIGLIALAFPIVPLATQGILLAVIIFLIALVLLLKGLFALSKSKLLGASAIIVAVLCFILCYELLFNTLLVSNIINLIIYLLGILVIIFGLIALISGKFSVFSAVGLSVIIFAFITALGGFLLNNPRILGAVIGIWLIVSAILSLFTDPYKNYIEI